MKPLTEKVTNRINWFVGYKFGIYRLNWWLKEKLGNRNMHDNEMYKKLGNKILCKN